MNARRMTVSDYVKLGLSIPDELLVARERVIVHIYAVERCEICGDEQGECACEPVSD